MRRIPPFVYGHVGGALIAGVVAGAFLDLTAVMVFSGALGGCALVSALVCWWWPGFAGAGWKLWLVGVVASPLFLAGVAFSIIDYECLIGSKSGWNCLFSEVGPDAAAFCLLPPLLGLAVRWGTRHIG